jgi:hypothetical protein
VDHQQANDIYMHDGVRRLELAQSAGRLFRKPTGAEKRRLLGLLVSNCTLADGKAAVTLKQPFDMIAEAAGFTLAVGASAGTKTRASGLAGVLGLEPRNGGTKNRCLTTWRHPNMGRNP